MRLILIKANANITIMYKIKIISRDFKLFMYPCKFVLANSEKQTNKRGLINLETDKFVQFKNIGLRMSNKIKIKNTSFIQFCRRFRYNFNL